MKQKKQEERRGRFAAALVGAMAIVVAAAVQAGDVDNIRKGLAKLLPESPPDSIKPSPIKGLYEVVVGPQVLYMSGDGNYLPQGTLLDIPGKKNLTEPAEAQAMLSTIGRIGEEKMISFGPKDAKHTMTVFTDIDCPYCAKLHNEMSKYNEAGIRVRYLFFPRAGVGSPSYDKAVAVWCADDRKKAMTDAKAGKKIEMKKCDNPVVEHMKLGEQMGVRGTPALVLDDGEMLPGYVPASRLSAYFEQKNQGSAGK
ncbi:MAG TPA: DsbC family protein [Chromatiales bacterium]|nr:DsbC family protein [Chromatiales bacterium]